jgi:hypothetical protein
MNTLNVPGRGLSLRLKVLVFSIPVIALQLFAVFRSSCDVPLRAFLLGTLVTQAVVVALLAKSQRLLRHLNLILVLVLWLVVWCAYGCLLLFFSQHCVRGSASIPFELILYRTLSCTIHRPLWFAAWGSSLWRSFSVGEDG